MQAVTIRQSIRPTRIAFLVKKEDLNALEQAVKLNTALWGGKFNPIILYDASDESETIDLLRLFDPDLVYPFMNLPSDSRVRKLCRCWPSHTEKLYLESEDKQLRFNFLDVDDLQHHFWWERVRIEDKSPCVFFKWDANSTGHLYCLFSFGTYPVGFAIDYERGYLERLKPTVIEIGESRISEYLWLENITPIDFTTIELQAQHEFKIFAGNPNEPQDLTDFWNLRALGYRVFFLPIDNFREFEKHVRKAYEIGTYRPRTDLPEWIEQPYICFHRDAPQSEEKEIADWIRGLMEVPTVTVYKISAVSWNGLNLLPHSYYSDEIEGIVHVIEGRVEFQADAPFFYRYSNVWPEPIWSNIITIHGVYRNQYFTRLPVDAGIEKQLRHYILGSSGWPGRVRLSNEGIVLHQGRMNQHVWLSLPQTFEVIKAMFETARFEISLSPPGQYAQQIIEKLGSLDGCRMFKVKGVRDALDLLNDGEEKKAGDILGAISRGLSEVPKDLFVEGRRAEELEQQFVFDWMLKHKMMRPGLCFRCTSCTKESWYHVSEFTERFTCRYCFTEQETPRLDTLKWWYRADGLYMLPNKMEGCIPVILTLWRILHHRGSSEAKYTTNISLKDMNNPDKNYELDFVCVFVDPFRGSHEIVLGESRGQVDYTQKDIDKIRSIAERFENPFLCFSTMKKAFSADEKQLLRQLIGERYNVINRPRRKSLSKSKQLFDEGYRVISLTLEELEPYDLYERFNHLPNKHVVSLEELARNTQMVNLV